MRGERLVHLAVLLRLLPPARPLHRARPARGRSQGERSDPRGAFAQGPHLDASCGWTTCHDDVLFVKTLLATLSDSLPVDREQVHLTGASNGGMLVYTLASDPDFADAFGGLVPVYGGILQGQLVSSFPSHARKMPQYRCRLGCILLKTAAILLLTGLLSMHDRSDTEIPPDGGIAQDGWLCTRPHAPSIPDSRRCANP